MEFSAALIKKKSFKLKPYSGYQIPSKGVVTLLSEHKGNIYNFEFQVIEIEAVLSAQTCKEMRLLLRIQQPQESQLKEQQRIPECLTPKDKNILNNYSDLFQGLGCIPGEHTIKLDPSTPAVVYPPRKVPMSIKDKIKEELDCME